MTIKHPEIQLDDGPFVFAALMGFTCSICAARSMSQAEVEAWANTNVIRAHGDWKAVDKSKPPISIPGETPNPCNQMPEARLHWFLISE